MGPQVYGAPAVVPPREFRITQELIEYDFNLNQAFDLVTSYSHRPFWQVARCFDITEKYIRNVITRGTCHFTSCRLKRVLMKLNL